MLDDEREICLNCKKPRCTNCMAWSEREANGVTIARIDPQTGETLDVYPSVKAAIREFGISKATLYRCLNHQQPLAGGYRWERVR